MVQIVINFFLAWFLLSIPVALVIGWILLSKSFTDSQKQVQVRAYVRDQHKISNINAYQLEEVA